MKGWLIVAVVVVVIGGLVVSGIVDPETVWNSLRSIFFRSQAETRQFFSTEVRSPEHANICKGNLKVIEGAKRRYAQMRGLPGGTKITWDDLQRSGALKEIPGCPDGGSYTLNPLGILPICSVGTNGTPANADDHIIHNW